MAIYEGRRVCDKSEYHAAFDRRLQFDQLTRGEIYVARFDILYTEFSVQALARIKHTDSRNDTTYASLQFVEDDFTVVETPQLGAMKNGVWNSTNPFGSFSRLSGRLDGRMINGFFRDYDDGSVIDDVSVWRDLLSD